MSSSVAIVVNGERHDALETATTTLNALTAQGIHAELTVLSQHDASNVQEALESVTASLIVSLGGDGTFLRAAARAHALNVPVLGVNFGRVGYLLQLPPTELAQVIEDTIAGKVHIEDRYGLQVTLDRPGEESIATFSVNEISVEKTVPGHVVRLASTIDGDPFMTFSADGVLIATPMGSTAYNLSAGGPILAPGLAGFVMTPVAPHFAINRSIVLTSAQSVRLEVVGDRPGVCVVDGVEIGSLKSGDSVTCRQHEQPLHVVTLSESSIGSRLRENLRQGHE
jgi:NAD+ kinase